MIEGAAKDHQSATPDWQILQDLIDGVQVRETKNVLTRKGVTTEIFRKGWAVNGTEVGAIKHFLLNPGAIVAWQMHEFQTDHIFVPSGTIKLVLYDGRENSTTNGRINVFHLGLLRPTLIGFPPGIWHGFQNLSQEMSSFINFCDTPYCYENPDEWRLPPDTPKIPYRFST